LSSALHLPRRVIDLLCERGVPVVLNQNGVFYPAWYPDGWQRENERMAHAHATASHVLYQSEFCRRAAARFLGTRVGPGEVLYNAVDTNAFAPRPREPKRPYTFLLTGKIGRATAYRLMSSVAGLAEARKGGLNVRLVIAGHIAPDVHADAQRLVQTLHARDAISFTGGYGRNEAPGIYRAADAYLITKHNDPCPNVVLEALASGLPVLYSASGGIPELVGDDAGIGLAVPDTFEEQPAPAPSAIADGMARVMAAHAPMAEAARRRAVERFAVAPWIERHRRLFETLVHAAAA
jgi:glycosyltransferase involved in cell wall biosynthesis